MTQKSNLNFHHTNSDLSEPPPVFGNFFEGWSGMFTKDNTDAVKNEGDQAISPLDNTAAKNNNENTPLEYGEGSNETVTTTTNRSRSSISSIITPKERKNSVQLGRRVISEILDNDNVTNAIHILQQALEHLEMANTEDENKEDVSKIYSQIIKSLCDKNISQIVDKMSLKEGKPPDIKESVLWRLFAKVVESGYVLERDAQLAVVNTLVDKGHKSLALQAMYAFPRREWDTSCYQTAVLLHLMQEPKQTQEAQGLLSDYGKPYLEIANPIAPNDLPPIRMEMPLMEEVTERDQFKLWMFYQAALSDSDQEWHRIKQEYEQERKANLEELKEQEEESIKDWAMTQLQIETRKQEIDRISTDNDNTMIFVAMKNNQFEYGWQVYLAMADAVNDATPCIVMHLCWVAFRQIPIADISRRTDWETRAWSVYSRFMCSEYLHPEENEAPGFLHDILSIAAHSSEVDKRARYTKSMSIYSLLVRLHFDKLLCDDRVLEPILCTLLYECKGSPTHIVTMCSKAFEIWDRKLELMSPRDGSHTSFSLMWGLLVLCLKSGNQSDLDKVLVQLSKRIDDVPSSLVSVIQTFHDQYICNDCYFYNYLFRFVEYTDSQDAVPIIMDGYGFLHSSSPRDSTADTFLDNQQQYTTIHEPQAASISMAVIMGVAKQEKLVPKQMYHSTKKARALVRHCLQRSEKKALYT